MFTVVWVSGFFFLFASGVLFLCKNFGPRMGQVCSKLFERNNSCYFSRTNQQKAGTNIYSLTQCSLTVNECDWHILAGNDVRINSHCLIRCVNLPLWLFSSSAFYTDSGT